MLENNLVFSLIVSFVISSIMYCINYKKDTLNEEKRNEIIILFGVTFTSIFLFRILSQNKITQPSSGGNISSVNYKPPF
jgi:hypothetical protein